MKKTFCLWFSPMVFFLTLVIFSRASGRTASPWIEKSSIAVMKVHTTWEQNRWSKAEQIYLKAVNTLLQSGAPGDAWQYDKLAHYANLMQTCDILAITAESMAAYVTDEDNRVFALAGLISTYQSCIRVRMEGVREGFQKARTQSKIEDVRNTADEFLKMLDEYDQKLITPRLQELEQLQKTVGTPPNSQGSH